ncbi:DUF2851 family protein [Oceaniferula spumae]|uniref:DUF2851 family protein n=1 Tax=Oceaniferula spumae TaxID=2979115 RepID=UPI003F4F3186
MNSLLPDSGKVREHSSGVSKKLPDEMHLQALWFAGQMGREFITVDGRKVRIVQFGHWNHSAGPDFLHAAVEIDGELLSGPLELDHRASDWEAHGHAVNEAFNEVVLHVVFAPDSSDHYTRTADHREVPRVCVPYSVLCEALDLPFLEVANAHPGRCFQPLSEMDGSHIDSLMLGAARHRAQIKARRRKRTIDVAGEDGWLWQAIAETLGYRPNKLAMTLLAQRLPIDMLKGNPESAESIIFGAAGFLSAEIHDRAAADSRDYLRGLWETWWQVRDDYEPVPERAIPWKLSGIRPVNHPQRRLACLARIVSLWKEFSRICLTTSGAEPLSRFFEELNHPYWNHHYTLTSKRSDKDLALLGPDRLRDFQINHLLPVHLEADRPAAWEYYQKIPAPSLSEKVDKASIRLFGDTVRRKSYLKKAWQHQALLQIYQDFCLRDASDCKECPFPEQLGQWRG